MAFVVVPKQVNPLDLSLANTAGEAQYLAVAFPNLPLVLRPSLLVGIVDTRK